MQTNTHIHTHFMLINSHRCSGCLHHNIMKEVPAFHSRTLQSVIERECWTCKQTHTYTHTSCSPTVTDAPVVSTIMKEVLAFHSRTLQSVIERECWTCKQTHTYTHTSCSPTVTDALAASIHKRCWVPAYKISTQILQSEKEK